MVQWRSVSAFTEHWELLISSALGELPTGKELLELQLKGALASMKILQRNPQSELANRQRRWKILMEGALDSPKHL